MAWMGNIQDLLIFFFIIYNIILFLEKSKMSGENVSHLVNLRNKGIKKGIGKVHKGCVKDAFTKLSIGSIPSNYESIIYHHQQKKGFGTSQKRFIQNRSQIIKPQIYENNSSTEDHIPIETKKSKSSKVFGLTAKDKSEWVIILETPELGKYYENKQIRNLNKGKQKKRKCYTRQRQDYKRRQLILNKQNQQLPGPGFYDANKDTNNSLTGWKSSFMTKLNRDTYIPKMMTPGPGYYNDKDRPIDPDQQKRDAPDQQYYKILVKQKKVVHKHYVDKRKPIEIPGPGSYHAELPTFKPIYQKIKISHNFMHNSKNRFNEPEQIKQVHSGPTGLDYQIISPFDKIEKKMIHMPCFMSQSRRQPFKGSGLGPNLSYDVTKPIEANFHFNIRGKWV